jgi:hypothetical protein
VDVLATALGDAHGDVPAHRTDQPFQSADASLTRIVAYNVTDGIFGDLALLRLEAGCG